MSKWISHPKIDDGASRWHADSCPLQSEHDDVFVCTCRGPVPRIAALLHYLDNAGEGVSSSVSYLSGDELLWELYDTHGGEGEYGCRTEDNTSENCGLNETKTIVTYEERAREFLRKIGLQPS